MSNYTEEQIVAMNERLIKIVVTMHKPRPVINERTIRAEKIFRARKCPRCDQKNCSR